MLNLLFKMKTALHPHYAGYVYCSPVCTAVSSGAISYSQVAPLQLFRAVFVALFSKGCRQHHFELHQLQKHQAMIMESSLLVYFPFLLLLPAPIPL